jgi:hypothetical protein
MARRARFACLVLVLGAAAAVILLLLALASLLTALRDDPATLGKRYQLTAELDAGRAGDVEAIPGVRDAAPRYEVNAVSATALGSPLRLIAYPGDHTRFEAPALAEGRRARSAGEAEVGAGLADAVGLRVGSILAVQPGAARELRFRVVGIVRALQDEGRVAYVRPKRLAAALPFLDGPLAVRLEPGADRQAVRRDLRSLGAEPRPVSGATGDDRGLLDVLASLLRLVALTVALVSLISLVQALALTAAEREPLRGLLAMPAGITASLVLLRFLGMTRLDLATLPLPTQSADLRSGLVIALGLWLALSVARRRRPSRRASVVIALAAAVLLAYPAFRWSQLVMVASLLTVLYAAAVSLALPEQWEVARHDVTLATLWVGLAIGTPVALAAALYVTAAAAASAIAESVWMPPHRSYIAIVIAAAQTVTGVLAMGIGAITAPDLVTSIGALTVLVVVLALELVQIARRLNLSEAPLDLDLTASLAAFGATSLLALLLLVPVTDALAGPIGRPLGVIEVGAPAAFVVAVLATLLVIVARTVRPLLPDASPLASPLQRFVWAADPVPAGIAAFRSLERAVTATSRAFALFERNAGVWLAAVLIVALLVWSARP